MGDVVTFLDHSFNLATLYFHHHCGNASLLLCPAHIYYVDGTNIQKKTWIYFFCPEGKVMNTDQCSPPAHESRFLRS